MYGLMHSNLSVVVLYNRSDLIYKYIFCVFNLLFSFFAFFFFFFQAEDGIRDHCVTGVQTCALPISSKARRSSPTSSLCFLKYSGSSSSTRDTMRGLGMSTGSVGKRRSRVAASPRSEERRVGKECRSRGSPDHYKKKYEDKSTVR